MLRARDLCGGRLVTGVPTANLTARFSTPPVAAAPETFTSYSYREEI
jgi:hypothetical protein